MNSKSMFLLVAIAVIYAGVPSQCQDVDVDKLKNSLPEGLLPEGFNASALPSVDDAKNVIKEKCLKISGSDAAFEGAETASGKFRECLTELVDVETLQREIEDAQPNGELDTVFNKYCRKRTTAIDCMRNFTDAIDPCLSEKEIASKKTFVNIFTNLLNFVCHKDGDQIALFIAEKGPECFSDKKDALTSCVNSTLSKYIPSGPTTLENLPQLIMGVKECNDMNNLQYCVVKELEKCQESTPANLVESMFKFVRNETPCANITMAPRKNSASNTFSTSNYFITLASTLIMTLGAKHFL